MQISGNLRGEVNRDEWEFTYTAEAVWRAATEQLAFRKTRIEFWEKAKSKMMTDIRASGINVHESQAEKLQYAASNTGGGPTLTIDPGMQRDLTECVTKLKQHRDAAAGYDGWVQLLKQHRDAAQSMCLKLKHADWMYFFGK